MTELSLYVLDIVQNSVAAGASRIDVGITGKDGVLTFAVKDNGHGMSAEFLAKALDPFTTTRTTRRIGLGLPFLKQAAEQTGGTLRLDSEEGVGTELTAEFYTGHIDMPPIGDIKSTVVTLIQGSPGIRFVFDRGVYKLDTDELREQLGDEVPLNEPAVLEWIGEYVEENEKLTI